MWKPRAVPSLYSDSWYPKPLNFGVAKQRIGQAERARAAWLDGIEHASVNADPLSSIRPPVLGGPAGLGPGSYYTHIHALGLADSRNDRLWSSFSRSYMQDDGMSMHTMSDEDEDELDSEDEDDDEESVGDDEDEEDPLDTESLDDGSVMIDQSASSPAGSAISLHTASPR